MRVTRRTLQLALGVLWLLDGVLQCQSFMFTKAFAHTVIAPTGPGQWWVIAEPVHLVATLTAAHPFAVNAVFAAVQLALGLALFWRRTVRWALMGSVVWGVIVWWLGEGAGGIGSGETLLTGLPGAALLYAVVAMVAWAPRDVDAFAAPPSRWIVPAWVMLWVGGLIAQVLPAGRSGHSLTAAFSGAGSDAPGWLARLDRHLAHIHIGGAGVGAIVAAEVLVIMWSLLPSVGHKLSATVGGLLAAGIWLLTQGLGGLTTGQATDPNSGPLIIVLAVAVFAARSAAPGEVVVREAAPSRRLPSGQLSGMASSSLANAWVVTR